MPVFVVNVQMASERGYYLEDLKTIAAESKNAEDFKAKVSARYPQYSGQNYLDMTAGFFFA